MFNLYETFKARRFTETTATPKSTFKEGDENATALTSWIEDVDALRKTVYEYAVTETKTENDVFAAWKPLFNYFPAALIERVYGPMADKLHAEPKDVKIFTVACGKYVKSADGGKEWRDNTIGQFRKVVEDTIVDRIDGNLNKSIEQLEQERKARSDARKAAHDATIDKICKLLGCSKAEAEKHLRAMRRRNKKERAAKEYTAEDKKLNAQMDAAMQPVAKPAKSSKKSSKAA